MTEPDKSRPVIMAVQADITDPAAYRAYMDALLASGLFARFGATPLATGAVREPLEGDYGAGEIAALIEFPSAEAANSFWTCDDYRRIARLRAGAGRFRVGLWRKLPPS